MTTPSLAGDWAYRFSGFTIIDGTQCYLVGMGVLALSADGKITGKQSATITALTGTDQKLLNRVMELSGTYSSEGVWGKATLRFLKPGVEDERGTFDIIQVDADRFWMISTGAKQLDPNSIPDLSKASLADEINSGEAVRIRSVS